MPDPWWRCGECGGKCRVIDAAKMIIECTRCGTKSVAKPEKK